MRNYCDVFGYIDKNYGEYWVLNKVQIFMFQVSEWFLTESLWNVSMSHFISIHAISSLSITGFLISSIYKYQQSKHISQQIKNHKDDIKKLAKVLKTVDLSVKHYHKLKSFHKNATTIPQSFKLTLNPEIKENGQDCLKVKPRWFFRPNEVALNKKKLIEMKINQFTRIFSSKSLFIWVILIQFDIRSSRSRPI